MIIVEHAKETAPKRSYPSSGTSDYTMYVLQRLKDPQLPPCPHTVEEQREWADYHFAGLVVWRDYLDYSAVDSYLLLDDLWTNSVGTNKFMVKGPQKFFLTTTFRSGGSDIHVATTIKDWEKYTSVGRMPGEHYNSFTVEDSVELLVETGAASVCDPESTIELLEMQVASALGAGFCPPRPVYLVDRAKIILTIAVTLQNLSYSIDWEMCARMLKLPIKGKV